MPVVYYFELNELNNGMAGTYVIIHWTNCRQAR